MMDIPLLLVIIMGLATTKVEGSIIGKLPPLPEKGSSNVKKIIIQLTAKCNV